LLLLSPLAGCNTTPPQTPVTGAGSASAPAGSASSAPPSASAAAPGTTPAATQPPAAPPPAAAGTIDCGTFSLDQRGLLPATAITCLIDAVKQRKQARLQVTRPTVEGDPIITWYAARSDGIVEVTRDATKDKFGGGVGITRELCSGPVPEGDSVRFERCDPA
jgi:hypothetical protein